jgi:hypothetical protein
LITENLLTAKERELELKTMELMSVREQITASSRNIDELQSSQHAVHESNDAMKV